MGFSSTGQIIITGWGNTSQELIGPVLPINIWTHVVDTFSTTNGHRLYINGTLISTTGPMIYTASGQVNILTLANRLQGIPSSDGGPCNSLSILPNVYYGSMDEFRVYSRELNATDVHTLANP
jgi:hypothetical protein